MGLLRSLFGPSREEIWRLLADQLDGRYVVGGWMKSAKVQVHVGAWTVTLDEYTESDDNSSTTYTRLRAPYVNLDGFRFTLHGTHLFSFIAEALGFQDIQVGDPAFDAAFVLKGNNSAKVRQLFADARLRALIRAQPAIAIRVRDDEGWFGQSFPDGVDELSLSVPQAVRNLAQLRSMYDCFAALLHRLCHIGSAYENDPGIVL